MVRYRSGGSFWTLPVQQRALDETGVDRSPGFRYSADRSKKQGDLSHHTAPPPSVMSLPRGAGLGASVPPSSARGPWMGTEC